MDPGADGDTSRLLRRPWVAVGLAHSQRRQQRLHSEEDKISQGLLLLCGLL